MAHVKHVLVYTDTKVYPTGTVRVFLKMKPEGVVGIDVPIPPAFYKCLRDIAQHAADLHEAQMRAEILADGAKETENGET